MDHRFPDSQIKMFSFGLQVILALLLYMTNAFSDAVSSLLRLCCSVVPDVLNDLLLKLIACYTWWLPRRHCMSNTHLPSFESFHPFVNIPVGHIVVTILDYHSCVNFTSFLSS
jgi:hypothetical protein